MYGSLSLKPYLWANQLFQMLLQNEIKFVQIRGEFLFLKIRLSLM